MIPAAHVIFCLDCSSSMSSMREPTQEAYNSFVSTLQLCKGAEIKFTRLDFGKGVKISRIKKAHIQDVPVMIDYDPDDGGTALNEVVGKAIAIAKESEATEKPILVVQTDGFNNQHGPTNENLTAAITKGLSQGWEVLFLGADIGKMHREPSYTRRMWASALAMGFPRESILVYGTDEKDILAAFEEAAVNVGNVASRVTQHANFTKSSR